MTTTPLTAAEAAAIRGRYAAVVKDAEQLFGLDLSRVELRLDLKGRAAGQALWKAGRYAVRLNPQAFRVGMNHLMNETIPHEVAHVVCFITGKGRGHDAGWRRVARALGCKGERCHSLPLPPAHGVAHRYVASCGTELTVSAVIHRRLQGGQKRRIRGTGGVLAAEHYAPTTTA